MPGAPAVVRVVVEDDEINDVMTDYALLKFRGVVSENAETWIRQFNNYCEYRYYNAEKTKQLFKVLLIDSGWWSGVVVSALASGPVSTEVGDRIRVQFPVRDIYVCMYVCIRKSITREFLQPKQSRVRTRRA